jgi:hypothetical protein
VRRSRAHRAIRAPPRCRSSALATVAQRHRRREPLVERDLERLAAEQRADGGWEIDFAPASPAAAIEWRGYVTVRAIAVLRGR